MVRRDGTVVETEHAATWLLAEGDIEVTKEENKWRSELEDADMVRRAIEEVRRSAEPAEDRHDHDEIMKVWTDGASVDNGTPDALARWGGIFWRK